MPRTFHSSTRAIKPLFGDAPSAPDGKSTNHWLAAAESSPKAIKAEKKKTPATKPTHHKTAKTKVSDHPVPAVETKVQDSAPDKDLPKSSPAKVTAPVNVADQTSRLLQHAPTIAHPPTDPNPQFNLHSAKGDVQWVKLPNQALHRLPDAPAQEPDQTTSTPLEIKHSFEDATVKPAPTADKPAHADTPDNSAPSTPKVRQQTIYTHDSAADPAGAPAEVAPHKPTAPKSEAKPEPAEAPNPALAKAQPVKSAAKKGLLKWLLITAAVCLVMLGGVAGWKYLSATFPGPDSIYPPSIVNLSGKITLIDGKVERQTTGDWEVLSIGQEIKAGDVIRTGDNAKAVITLDDGSAVRLDQNSSVAFDILTNQSIKLEQRTGQSYHFVHSGSAYQVSILDATVTAHGTSFATRLLPDQSNSEVAVTADQVTIVAAHVAQSVTAKANQIAHIDHLNHQVTVRAMSDQDLADSFLQWNQQLDRNPNAIIAATPSPTPTPTAEPTPTPTPVLTSTPVPTVNTTVSALFMTAVAQSGAVRLNWKITGSAPTGFKLMMSVNPNPTFPPRSGDTVVDLPSPDARSYTWANPGSGPHHFRLGVYNGHGGTRWYSNDVTATALP